MPSKQPLFQPREYIQSIPFLVEKILDHKKVTQLTEKQALEIAKLKWWERFDDPKIPCIFQLYMTRQCMPMDLFVDQIGLKYNYPLSIEHIQNYRLTILNHYRQE